MQKTLYCMELDSDSNPNCQLKEWDQNPSPYLQLVIYLPLLCSAFRNAENHRRLDHLFSLVFQRNLLAEELLQHGSRQTQFVEPMFDIVPGVRAISLPEETKVSFRLSIGKCNITLLSLVLTNIYFLFAIIFCVLEPFIFTGAY